MTEQTTSVRSSWCSGQKTGDEAEKKWGAEREKRKRRRRRRREGGSALARGNYRNRYEWRGEAGKGKEKVRVRGDVWVYARCYLLEKQMCFICRDTGGRFYKSLFSQVKPQSLLTTLLLPVWAFFFRLNLKWRFHTRTVQGSCKAALPSDRHRVHAVPPGPTESTETLSVMQGWRFVILKRGSNGLSGYWLACPLLLLLCYVLRPLSDLRQPQTH